MLILHSKSSVVTLSPLFLPTQQVNTLIFLAASVILNGAALTLKGKTAFYK